MSSMSDVRAYDVVIGALKTFGTQVGVAAGQMSSAGQAVVAGTNGDESAEKASARIQSLQKPIGEICSRAYNIAASLEDIRDAIIDAVQTGKDL